MIKFYHKVGKSTYRDGMTLPVDLYEEIKGKILDNAQSKDYELFAGDTVTKCRLLIVNIERNPIQISYRSRIDCPIKDWLRGRYQVNFENEFTEERYLEVIIDSSKIKVIPLEEKLDYYIDKLCKVRQNSHVSHPQVSKCKAAHKPILILAVLNLIRKGIITKNEIKITKELEEEYKMLWEYIDESKEPTIYLPFFHLQSDGFWILVPKEGMQIPRSVSGMGDLNRFVEKAQLPNELFYMLLNPENNKSVKERVINQYFIGEVKMKLLDDTVRRYWWVNQSSTKYKNSKLTGYIWSPHEDKRGNEPYHWKAMKEIKRDDIIINFSEGFIKAISIAKSEAFEADRPEDSYYEQFSNAPGWKVDVDYEELSDPIPKDSITSKILDLNLKYSPFNSKLGVNLGYVYYLNSEAMRIIYENMSDEDKTKFENLGVNMPDKGNIDRFSERANGADKFLLTAIKTKPFIILAGISGSGKSRIVRTLAYQFFNDYSGLARNERKPENFELISVKPDWHDSTELLGYESRISGDRYIVTKLVKFLIKAHKYPEVPFFLLLDEMNLAPVEQYFAEFLSVMESRRIENGKIISDALIPANIFQKYGKQAEFWDELELNALKIGDSLRIHGLSIPGNLIIIGTVNMDETTHTFSRKVLDRAFSLELDNIDMYNGLSDNKDWKYPSIPLDPKLIIGNYTQAYQVYEELGKIGKEVISILVSLNNYLEGTLFKVGYRVRDDFLVFCKNYLESGNDEIEISDCIDKLIKMKVLSRIEGDRTQTEDLINELIDFTEQNRYEESKAKLEELKSRLDKTEYTSYWK